jgi:hypothetical protein|tara:strand:- start:62 stop:241 length:180 start_codon:yes stop_codon:yes gene_type:complete
MQPGDLVKYDHPANPTLGLVKSVKHDHTWGNFRVLVQWCNDNNTEEYVWQEYLKVVGNQ